MLCLALAPWRAAAQTQPTAYFVDGYHGGIYGHYPPGYTQFIVDSLRAHPAWNINLEIEPATWDFVATNAPEEFRQFAELAADQSAKGRVEFVNPAYGQGYLWNISGESIIQQFDRGIRKIREHFPNAAFTTYSSEEPCFTSALPGILKSFGFTHAVLKNPNTCWGGYTRAFGGELVNWIGPDGTALPTVPRYAIEAFRPRSTWETIACANQPEYLQAAFAAGIAHPIGMCLQDAGWKNGPWLGSGNHSSQYVLWRDYFDNIAIKTPSPDWRVSQEDVQVSLVWGAQVLQRIAQQVRAAENRIVMAEKLATVAGVFAQMPWPEVSLDEGWRELMLAQHHDCWIVPYNGGRGATWADKVAQWTADTRRRSDEILEQSMKALSPASGGDHYAIRVFNSLGSERTELVSVDLPETWRGQTVKILDAAGNNLPVQAEGERKIFFPATVPSLGFNTYRLEKNSVSASAAPMVTAGTNGLFTLESDLYRLVLDARHGGVIQSWIAKKMSGRELVDTAHARRFNELRGFFPAQGAFLSTADQPAEIEIVQNGPLQAQVRIHGALGTNAVTQTLMLTQGQPRVDFSAQMDWRGNTAIGADPQAFRGETDRKAFYDDRFKLLALFPLNLQRTKIFKDAPFDVTESHFTNTFFENWSGIKNNVILNWVDEFDAAQNVGVALFSDHTTSYAHGEDHPLGLNLQYSGGGLWGRDYSLRGPTEVRYALLPHTGDWQQGNVWLENCRWNEPLMAKLFQANAAPTAASQSLLRIEGNDWEIPTMRLNDGKVFVRLFNPARTAATRTLHYIGPVSKIELVQLNHEVIRELPFSRTGSGSEAVFSLTLPPFGLATLRITP